MSKFVEKTARGHTIRRLKRSDVQDVLGLYEAASDRERTEDWFRWKFVDNPYADSVPAFVTEIDGRVAGFQSYLPLPARVGTKEFDSAHLVNAMVHPDYQGRGLYSDLVEEVIGHCVDNFDLVVTFLNGNTQPIFRHLGWTDYVQAPVYYRVQHPEPLLEARGDRWFRLLGRVATPATRLYLDGSRLLARSESDVAVSASPGVDPEHMASLYRRNVPKSYHVKQDAQYYRWRFDSPFWDEHTTYTASKGGVPIAATITRTTSRPNGIRLTQLADHVPLAGGESWSTATSRLLAEITSDHPSADVIVADEMAIPGEIDRKHGFLPDYLPILSNHLNTYELLVIDTPDVEVDHLERTNWALQLAVRESS